ncbi:MAG: hypothetical protein JOZ08_15840 [Verrucomicrobia bacterium]|nr:hypothetical protein [Verrucomicrobiota bacterium]MBV8278065.1 hypothetical protein [Verrucomicrobiota bacterium]
MSATYKAAILDHQSVTWSQFQPEHAVVYPLGTFAGTIEKVSYRCNGTFVPSDTSNQLIAAGLS